MKKVIAAVIIPLMVLGFAGLSSCKNATPKKQRMEQEKVEVSNIRKEIEKNVYPLPTSAQVIKMLTDLEVGYIIGISNPVDNAKKYYTNPKRSINLGVYGADLSYATLYNMNQEVMDYMGTIRIVANDLNMSGIYNQPLYDSIKKNFDNKDRLVKILTDAFNDTYTYMSENEQQPLALLVVGGAWVEGMFLTTHVSEAAYNVAGISKVLLEQKKSFELYLDVTKPYLDNQAVADFVKSLDPIKTVYAGIGTSLTEQNIKDITAAITVIRGKAIAQ
ncbi:MAG TPA: hypothetical protein VMT63_11930 [Bacteroidales bacterium]|nr:hypothetical protein [Bacteroidales bacterium]